LKNIKGGGTINDEIGSLKKSDLFYIKLSHKVFENDSDSEYHIFFYPNRTLSDRNLLDISQKDPK
jgi:hypothetical protein